jgi:hypothetical protein
MERRLSVKHYLFILSFCLLLGQMIISLALGEELGLVFVTSSKSTTPALTAGEIRKLYLGVTLLADGQTIKPLRNNSDDYLQEVFMQKVMFMSTPTYERQILSRVFRIGGTRPPVYNNLDKLIDALEADPSTLSYMSRKDAQATPDIKIIGNVWENRD